MSESNGDVKLMYQLFAEDMRATKQHQWQTTYYVLLAHSVIFVFYEKLLKQTPTDFEKIFLAAITIIIALMGNIFLQTIFLT